jgi:hypothetical protein
MDNTTAATRMGVDISRFIRDFIRNLSVGNGAFCIMTCVIKAGRCLS